MHQSSLALIPLPRTLLPGDAIGFDIGWEHAQHGLVPAPEWLLEGSAIGQGWRAARAVLGQRRQVSTPALRQWLALRGLAWCHGIEFDAVGLGPAAMRRLQTGRCPVRRQPLGGASSSDDAPVVFRLNANVGYRPGNLVVLSRVAALAAQDTTVAEAWRHARAADASGMDVRGLHAAHWRRLTVLLSFASPLSFHETARLPLVVLPTPDVEPLHALQALQLLLTGQFLRPGWSARTRNLACALPHEAQRTDFNLFVSALASRALEAASLYSASANGAEGRQVLEDAWLDTRVQRRWQQMVLALGEPGCESLLLRVRALQGPADQGASSGPRHKPGSTRAQRPGLRCTSTPKLTLDLPAPLTMTATRTAPSGHRILRPRRPTQQRPGFGTLLQQA